MATPDASGSPPVDSSGGEEMTGGKLDEMESSGFLHGEEYLRFRALRQSGRIHWLASGRHVLIGALFAFKCGGRL